MIRNVFALSTALCILAPAAFAGVSFQFQMPGVEAPKGADVSGMRMGFLHARSNSVSGLDLGFVSFNETVNHSGFSFNFGISKVSGKSSGCSCSMVNLHEGTDSGMNAGLVNIVNSMPTGVNGAFLNVTSGQSSVDVGALNISERSNTQIGIVNATSRIDGVQIGLLNIADNGFVPVFPFFNYPKP